MAQAVYRMLRVLALIAILCGSSIAHHDPRCNPALHVQVCVDHELDGRGRLNLRCVESRAERPFTTNVLWRKNNVLHIDSTRVHSQGERLIFEEVLISDEGNWTCSNGSLSPPFIFYGKLKYGCVAIHTRDVSICTMLPAIS